MEDQIIELKELKQKFHDDIDSILKKNKTLYKYLDLDGAIKKITNHTLKFANTFLSNDPYDCYHGIVDWSGYTEKDLEELSIPNYEVEYLRRKYLENSIKNKIGVASLTTDYKNFLLWSYYNNHQGVCIGLDTDLLYSFLKRKNIKLYKVDYVKKFKTYNFWTAYRNDLTSIVYDRVFSLKSNYFKQEKEIRFVWRDINREIFLPIPPKCFKSIYLGTNVICGEKNKDKEEKWRMVDELIKQARKINPEIKIYQMYALNFAFELLKAELR